MCVADTQNNLFLWFDFFGTKVYGIDLTPWQT